MSSFVVQVTVADFHLFEMVDQTLLMAKKAGVEDQFKVRTEPSNPKLKTRNYSKSNPNLYNFQDYPLVAGIHSSIKADPKLKAYFEGPEYEFPQNNKMAKYGGDLNDGR